MVVRRLSRTLELVNTYASLNLKAEARKTYLGYLWWVIEPLLYVAVFYFVFNIIQGFGRGDYLLFLICGKIPFLWISKSIVNSAGSVLQNRGLLAQVNIQPLLFPLVALQENFYKQLPVFVLLILLAWWLGGGPGLHWLWLLPLTAATYLFIVPFALMGALVTSFIPDVRFVLSLATLFLMFMSGVFWDIRMVDPAMQHYLLVYNPVAFLLDAYRGVLMYGENPALSHLAGLCVALALLLAVTCWCFVALKSEINTRVINE